LSQEDAKDSPEAKPRGGSHGAGRKFDTSIADAVKTTQEEQRRRVSAITSGYRRDEPSARGLLSDRSPKIRSAALGALARMERATQIDVINALRDEAAEVRRTACELATRLPSVELVSVLDDQDPRVVEACAFALGECQIREAVPALIRVARDHDDPLCRETAVAALGNIGDNRSRATIINALNDSVQIRRRALIALANFSGDDVRQAIQDRLTDRDWQVRQAAEDLLGVSEEMQP